MNRIVFIALLVLGVVLLVFGIQASDSLSSEVSEVVEGAPSDKSIWLIALGILCTVVGGFGLLRRAR